MFPKIIHQLCNNKTELSQGIFDKLALLQDTNPDFEIRLYDEHDKVNYLREKCPEWLHYYNRLNPKYKAAQADFFRYVLMYFEGGVYLDLKSTIETPLSDLFSDHEQYKTVLFRWLSPEGNPWIDFYTSIGLPHGEIGIFFMLSQPQCYFFKELIQQVCHNIRTYDSRVHLVSNIGVLTTTGPFVCTFTYHRYFQQDLSIKVHDSLPEKYRIFPFYKHLHQTQEKSYVHYHHITEPVVFNNTPIPDHVNADYRHVAVFYPKYLGVYTNSFNFTLLDL